MKFYLTEEEGLYGAVRDLLSNGCPNVDDIKDEPQLENMTVTIDDGRRFLISVSEIK